VKHQLTGPAKGPVAGNLRTYLSRIAAFAVAKAASSRLATQSCLSLNSTGNKALEPLEARQLLAAAAWTGAAGDDNWSTPDNWSSGSVPVDGDDVTLDAGPQNPTIRFTADAGLLRLNSLVLKENLVISGGALWLNGGATASVLAPLNIAGGTIGGGSFAGGTATWDASASSINFTGSATSRIEGGVLVLGPVSITSARVKVFGTLALTGTATITNSGVDFESIATTIPSGTIILNNGRLGLALRSDEAHATGKSLTIAAPASVRGWGNVGGALFSERVNTSLVNDGTITADVNGRFLNLAPVGAYTTSLNNRGTIRAMGGAAIRVGALNLTNYSDNAGGTLTGGIWRADANSTLSLDYNRAVAVNNATVILGGANAVFQNLMEQIQVNTGTITLGSGMLWSRYYPLANRGTINLESISNLNLPVGGVHTGTFNVGAGSVLVINGSAQFDPSTRFLGTGIVIVSSGTLNLRGWFGAESNIKLSVGRNATVNVQEPVRLGSIEVIGVLNLGIHRVSLSGTFSQASSGRLVIDVRNNQLAGEISAAGTVTLTGQLDVVSSTAYDPAENQVAMFTAIFLRGSSVIGAFATTNVMTVSAGSYMGVNTGKTYELWLNLADFNGDGGVDGADLEPFYYAWSRGANFADVNGDGGTDGSDIEAFLTAWSIGGR